MLLGGAYGSPLWTHDTIADLCAVDTNEPLRGGSSLLPRVEEVKFEIL
jgi:hypothetical protein